MLWNGKPVAPGSQAQASVGSVEDPAARASLADIQEDLRRAYDRIAALEAQLNQAAPEEEGPIEAPQRVVSVRGGKGIRVVQQGHSYQIVNTQSGGGLEIPEVEEFPALPPAPSLIWYDGVLFSAGPDSVRWAAHDWTTADGVPD